MMQKQDEQVAELEARLADMEKQARFYRLIADNTVDWEVLRDSTGRIAYVNEAFTRITGYEREDLVAGRVSEMDVVHPEDWPRVREGIGLSVARKPVEDLEFRIVRTDGQVRHIHLCAMPVYEEGVFMGTRTSARDITDTVTLKEIQAMHARLDHNQRRFRTYIENSPLAIFIADSRGHFTFVNPEACRLLGYDDQELTRIHILSISPPEAAEVNRAHFESLRATKRNMNFQTVLRRKDGSQVSVVIDSIMLSENEHMAYVKDISARLKQEAKLRRYADDLRRLSRDKDRFMQIMAHDLRSPFNSMLGFSDLLRRNFRAYGPEKNQQLLDNIHEMASRTYALLNELLMWSQAQQGKLAFEPQRLLFSDLCVQVIQSMSADYAAKHQQISYFETEGLHVMVDTNMLKAVLRNLLSNAIKFTPKGGKIDVFLEKVLEKAQVSVADSGVGIPPEDQAKLWDMSQQHSRRGTEGEKGTGLGLLICKEFVERHGGQIWVESQVDAGSEFKFTLPLAPARA